MKSKKWSIWLTCALVAVLMIAGMVAIAAEYGSQSDPLVTLSYIEEILLPQAQEDVDGVLADALEDYEDELEDSSDDLQKYIDRKLRSFAAGDVDDDLVDAIAAVVLEQLDPETLTKEEPQWTTVEIPAGKTLTCEVGAQFVVRKGQATCVAGGTPGLIDLSNGETAENGGALLLNHLYVASAQGRGFAAAKTCTVLICGNYTIK